MSIIAVIDGLATLSVLVACISFLRTGRTVVSRDLRVVLLVLLFLNLFRNTSNLLEWSSLTSAFDALEDYFEILLPVCYFCVIYLLLRAQQESILVQSEENLKALLNASLESVFLLDSKGNAMAVNNIAAKRLGKTVPELLGQSIFEQFSNELAASRRYYCRQALVTGHPVEFRDVRGGRIFETRVCPIAGTDVGSGRVAVFGEDVTASVRAVEKLQFEREILALINQGGAYMETVMQILHRLGAFLNADIGVIHLVKGGILSYQKGTDSIVQKEEETGFVVTSGESRIERFFSEMAKRMAPFQDVLDTGIACSGELTPSGSFCTGTLGEVVTAFGGEGEIPAFLRAVHDRGYETVAFVPLRSGDNRIGWLCLAAHAQRAFRENEMEFLESLGEIIGVSLARKEMDDALREREVKLGSIFRASPAGIAVVIDGLLVEVNDRMCSLTGRNRDELLGSPEWTLYTDRNEFKYTIAEVDRQMLAAGHATVETKWVGPEGLPLDVLLTYAALDSIEDPDGRIFTAMDISFQTRETSELHTLRKDLEHAEHMAVLGHLAGGLANDFSDLLQIIRGNAEFLVSSLDQSEPFSATDLAAEITGAVDTASSLMKQIHEAQWQNQDEFRLIDLERVVRRGAAILTKRLTRHWQIEVTPVTCGCSILGDPFELGHVIVALGLAISRILPDGGRMTWCLDELTVVESENDDAPPGIFMRVLLTVSDIPDSGQVETVDAGIPVSDCLCSGAVQQGLARHNAVLRCTQEPAGSLMVSLLFPIFRGEASKSRVIDTPSRSVQETILVAEDEPGVRRMVVRLLEFHGYAVIEASDGFQAIGIIKHHRGEIDLALLDVVMPGLGGRGVYDAIQESEEHIPVVFCSGHSDVFADSGSLPPGAHLLKKPYEPALLIATVRQVIAASQGMASVTKKI